jgi:SAM-dependent methyltransferase
VNISRQRQREWENRYRAGSTGWDRGGVSPAFEHWRHLDGFRGARVLVPGCGSGYEVVDMARAGCQVTAVDIAAQPVMRLMGLLADQGLHAQVVQADLLHWQPAEPFDAVYEQTCLCALDPAQWSIYEARLVDWLLPGGTLFALFMQTGRAGGPPFDCPLPAMQGLFDATRWQWPQQEPMQVPHPNGLVEKGVVLRRR